MDEDVLNFQIRKFLKRVGVTSQREIEKAVRSAVESGALADSDSFEAVMQLRCEAIGLDLEIRDTIGLK